MKVSHQVVFESDWLASRPFFYDELSGCASQNINDLLVSKQSLDIHSEGLTNYLDCGFSVLCQTPIKDIKFLPASSKLYRDANNKLILSEPSNDPIQNWFEFTISESEIVGLIRSRVQEWESSLREDQLIILPLSGGYDSRLLLWSLRDRSRVRAFTYGISKNQVDSKEAIYAKELADHFKINWELIHLGNFHKFIPEWYEQFGISTHAHGMYHIEFYKEITKRVGTGHALLSGIIGDAWSGSISKKELTPSNYLLKLSHNHNIRVDPSFAIISSECFFKDRFWKQNSTALDDVRYQTVTAMRFKIILLSYLISIPQRYGLNAWSPFLDIDIAMGMLNLPSSRRTNRQWQAEFFAKEGLDLEARNINASNYNSLNRTALKNIPLRPLDEELLSGLFDISYLRWINNDIRSSAFNRSLARILAIPKVGKIIRLSGIRDSNLEAYYAYLCLKPLELLLQRGIG
jgi:hypothetical protein